MDFGNIKTILRVAGINRLQIQFDDEQQLVNAEYVFKGKPGTKRITYKEIIKLLSIGYPEPGLIAGSAQAPELRDLPRET